MIYEVSINDLHAVLVHKLFNSTCINIDNSVILNSNIYNNPYIQHIICNLLHVPHIGYINNDKYDYVNYMKTAGKYAGFGIEHSFETFNNLIKNFEYLQEPYENEYITCKVMFDKLVIVNGLHRASILKSKNLDKIKIKIVE